MVQVINDNNPENPEDVKGKAGHKNFMWVHRSGEFETEHPTVLYEYQRTRHHKYPLEYYKGFDGILETDGPQQYHILEKKLQGFQNANCWAHARRIYSDAIKALKKDKPEAVIHTIAYQALARIAIIYKLENALKEMSSEERLKNAKKRLSRWLTNILHGQKPEFRKGRLWKMKHNFAMNLYWASRVTYKKKLYIISKIFSGLNRLICDCQIPATADLSRDTYLLHNGLGVVIHEKAKVGRNVTICQNVTIGGGRGGAASRWKCHYL